MENSFNNTLYDASEKKVQWYNNSALPKMLENYRTFHSSIKNMTDIFEKKKLLSPDPYKQDKRVVDIEIPSTDDFPDSEGATILGIRFSDYESSLDFLCNYMQFTVEALQPERLKKLFLFNSFIDWANLTGAASQGNHRYFSIIVNAIKNGKDPLSLNLLNSMLTVAANAMSDINGELKRLASLHRQLYKVDVRKNVLDNPTFLATYANMNLDNGLAEIKKVFPSLMEKKRFYPDLIEEIVKEDFSSSKESLQKTVLEVFQIANEKKESKEKEIDTRAMIFEVVKMLQAFAPTLDVLQKKISENHELLQSEKKTGFAKFIIALKSAFGLQEKTVEYKIKTVEMQSQIEKFEVVDYNKFMDGMFQRIRTFQALGVKGSPLLSKLENDNEEGVLEFVQKRISDCQSLYGTLAGFDNFFKSEVAPSNRSKVKGLKIDLDVIKNTILKANKHKAEYVSTVTTEQQMKKLGITND